MKILKKYIKISILTSVIILIISLFKVYDFKSSFIETEYIEIKGTDSQIIKTPYFNIQTPSNWIYLDKGLGMDSFIGSFWTGKGFLHYDYGSYGCQYDSSYCKAVGIEHQQDTIEGFVVNMGKDKWGMGFYVQGIPISFDTYFIEVDYKEITRGLIKNNKW